MLKNFGILAVALFLVFLVRYFYFKPMLVFGQPCPPFSEKMIDGRNISLDSFEGKYVLIDFWGSWCTPCRKENPILLMMFEKYKDRQFKSADGFTILSVGLEKDLEVGLKAIAEDKMIWPHHIVQTGMLESPMAEIFGVKQIPTKYLLGPKGQILLSDPNIAELDDFLARDSN